MSAWFCAAHRLMSTGDCPRCDDELAALTESADHNAPACGEQYGHNPDACYRERGHEGAHSNRWGTTWASAKQWRTRVIPPEGSDR